MSSSDTAFLSRRHIGKTPHRPVIGEFLSVAMLVRNHATGKDFRLRFVISFGITVAKQSGMILKHTLKSFFATSLVVASILAAGTPVLAAENASSPAPAVSARISTLSGKLFDQAGKPLKVGSELKAGDIVKTQPGETARLMIASNGTSSSMICIESDSEVVILKLTPSADSDYPLLDTVISLRNDRVRDGAKRIW